MRIIDQYSIKVTWKLFTFSLFISTICQKIPFLLHGVLWTPKLQNLYILMGMDEGVLLSLHFLGVQSIFFRCTFNPFQMCNQSFSNFNFRIFEFLLLLLWWFTPAFMMRWFNIDWIPMDIALILFLTLIAIFSCREYKIFRPGK